MVFPSFTGKARRGDWPKALLPSSTPRSKLPRKPRKRSFLREFLFANFFTVGVSITIFFFVFLLICYGVPKPFSSHFRTPISRIPKPRKLPYRKLVPSDGAVDITTKDLYDRIEFLDVDGGPWKQGWMVNYKGDEWDSEKLKVFVVPHSHNDPGWRLTVEEYYEKQSRHILDTIVETLSKDSRRRFVWEEMSYLERWWRDAPNSMKKSFAKLVRTGQLEIVGGGWVMNDEANSHYFAILEQITEGNLWLNDTIGVVPKNSWAIDPFGYSPTMAYLFRRMGFENMLIQRTHYELKKELALHKNLEFIWRQSWDAEESTDIFVHMMPFYSYDIPHTCGPEPAICCQFDFARMPEFSYERCPWGQHPQETTKENLQERALTLLDQYRKKSTLYRTNTLLVPLGDDFRYVSIDEAEAQFRNYQQLFDYINSSPNLNAEVQFGTLEDYFRCLREEAERINYAVPEQLGSNQIRGFPSLSGDFFTYADRQHDYWSGYYVSRPFFKAVDRVLEHTLRAADMMVSLLLAHCQRPLCEKLPMTFAHKLTAARRNLALFQHHDGVTGTAKDHVVVDYGNRMHTSLDDLQVFMSKAIEVFLGLRRDKSDHSPSQFEPALVRSEYDVQPVHKSIRVHAKAAHTVVFFNPIEQTREEVVMVVAERPDVVVLDANLTCVKSQVSPEVLLNSSKHFSGKHRVYWRASIPALGLQTYYVTNGFVGCEPAKRAELKFYTNSTHFHCPASYTCTNIPGDVAIIQNRHLLLSFNLKYGLLSNVTASNGSQMVIHEEIDMYSSHESGAYLFIPDGDAEPIIQPGGHFVIIDGPLVHEAYSYPKTEWMQTPISHVTRLYDGEDTLQEFVIEKEYHIELLGRDLVNKELIVRYKTDIDNHRIFYSDLNGLQTSRRETYDKIPLQGNYYPMPSIAFMHGIDGRRFSVHSRQALGVASLKNGWLEIMLDRRLSRDDGRGLGQGVMDNRPLNVVFNIIIETNTSSAPDILTESCPLRPSLNSHRVGSHLNYPLHVFISRKAQELSFNPPLKLLAPLASSLPCDLHIVSFKVPHILKYSEHPSDEPRFVITLNRRNWDNSYGQMGMSGCASLADVPVNLFYMFKGLVVSNVKSTSLNLLHDDMEMLGYVEQFGDVAQEGHLLISPMEIQAYKLELQPHAD